MTECGCRFTWDGPRVTLLYCDLHGAAPSLLAALEHCEKQLRSWHIGTKPASKVDVRVQEALDMARAAIRKACGT